MMNLRALVEKTPDALLNEELFDSLVGDKGYSADALREHVWSLGARPAIPPRRSDLPVACPE